MAIPAQVRAKFYALRTLAALIALSASAAFIFRPHDFGSRSLALLGVFLVLWLVKRSNILVWRARGDVLSELVSDRPGRVGRLAWTVTAASAVLSVVFYLLMYQIHDDNTVWPVYAFTVSGLVLAVASSYIAMKTYR